MNQKPVKNSISCVLLSAGLSQRFGSPKALAGWGQQTVIQHVLQILLKLELKEIIVVLGSNSDDIRPYITDDPKINVVINENYHQGQTSSFKKGLSIVSEDACGIMLLPIDFPNIKSDTFKLLINFFECHKPRILIPSFDFKRGHPPIFNISLINDLRKLKDGDGVDSIIQKYTKDINHFTLKDQGILESFNTVEELNSIQRKVS